MNKRYIWFEAIYQFVRVNIKLHFGGRLWSSFREISGDCDFY